MKKVLLATALACMSLTQVDAAEQKIIRISTDNTDLVLQVAPNGRLYQSYFGEKLLHENDLKNLPWNIHAGSDGSVTPRGWEVYSGSGNEDYFEPAVAITHSDGNPSTYLYYVSSSTQQVEGGTQTTINLRDDKYPVVQLLYGGKYNGRSPEVVDAESFIGVKSHRAKGKRLSNLTLEEVIWLEPLQKEAPANDDTATESGVSDAQGGGSADGSVMGAEDADETETPGGNQLELF